MLVGGRTVLLAVIAMALLLSATNAFKSDDDAVSRALNYGARSWP